MKQFFETTDGKLINLRNVTSIAFEDYTDKYGNKKQKIIFNLNYGVSLRNNRDKIISDYVYSVYNNSDEFYEDLAYLMYLVQDHLWIKCKEPRIINPESISFVTYDYDKYRIILNIATSVSFHGNIKTKTSDFIYINCDDMDEFTERMEDIREVLVNLDL